MKEALTWRLGLKMLDFRVSLLLFLKGMPNPRRGKKGGTFFSGKGLA
jgi:hypothetical protein